MPSKDVKKAKKLFEQKRKEKEQAASALSASEGNQYEESKQTDAAELTPASEPVPAENSTENRDESDKGEPFNEEPKDKSAAPESTEAEVETSSADAPLVSSASPAADASESAENKKSSKETEDLSKEPTKRVEPVDHEGKSKERTGAGNSIPAAPQAQSVPLDKGVSTTLEQSESQESTKEPLESQLEKMGINENGQGPSSNQFNAKIIAALRQENEDLKVKNKKLESTIARLEGELSVSRQSELEVPLSHAYSNQDNGLQTQRSRNRSSSFVEAELYSEADKINARTEQMDKWKGYQLDLREWQRLAGIGPIVSV